ncbi:hypothetical protein KA082_03220 [Candidatus Woesebacteria bacterium]|nr:hypothetical protein [Candidatus Woesebacteria bacterium]
MYSPESNPQKATGADTPAPDQDLAALIENPNDQKKLALILVVLIVGGYISWPVFKKLWDTYSKVADVQVIFDKTTASKANPAKVLDANSGESSQSIEESLPEGNRTAQSVQNFHTLVGVNKEGKSSQSLFKFLYEQILASGKN